MKVHAITMNDLIDVYLDGFASGVLTIQVNLGAPRDQAWEFAQQVAAQVTADPAIVEMIRGKITDRLGGRDSGPRFLPMVDGS